MQSNVYMTASGPVLSHLLYENTKASGNQVGFLLGAVVNQVIDTISDSQIRGEKTETIINISSILPIAYSSGVINGLGKIDQDKLCAVVRSEKTQQRKRGSQSHDVVGWYSFKRNSPFQMSMRDHVIHQQVAEIAKDLCSDSAPELFVMCLLSTNLTSKATHVFKHSFMRFIGEKQVFELIPLQIHNLGMSQPQYQNTACPTSRAALLQEIFEYISSQNHGRDHMLQVQSELQKMLNQRVVDLSAAESTRIALEREVDQLKKQLEKMTEKQQGPANTVQEQNNGSDNGVKEHPKDYDKQKNHKRTINSNADGDKNEESSSRVFKTSENHLNNERPTSPVFGAQRRRPSNRPATPEMSRSGFS